MFLGVMIKHNLVVLPLAVWVTLFVADRKKFWTMTWFGATLGGAAAVLLVKVFDGNFIKQVVEHKRVLENSELKMALTIFDVTHWRQMRKDAAMSDVCCKRCGASDYRKNGIVRGTQRYFCHSCGCNFTMTPPCGKPPAMKALALLLYAMGNMSFCSIARLLGVSDVTVLHPGSAMKPASCRSLRSRPSR